MCRVQPVGAAEALQICRGLRLIYSTRAFSRRKRGDPLGAQLRFVSRIVLTGWVVNLSIDMRHVARYRRACRDSGSFKPLLLAATAAAVVAFTLPIPVKPAAAQGLNAVWYEYPARPRLKVRPKAKPQAPVPDQVSKDPFGRDSEGAAADHHFHRSAEAAPLQRRNRGDGSAGRNRRARASDAGRRFQHHSKGPSAPLEHL